MARNEETGAQKQDKLEFLDESIQRVGEDALEGGSTFFYRYHNALKARFGQHHARRRLGDIRRRGNGDAHLRLAQGGRIIGPSPRNADGMSAPLKRFNQPEFVFGKDAGVNGKISGIGAVRYRPRWTDPPLQPDCRGDVSAVGAASPVTITVSTRMDRSSASSSFEFEPRRIAEGDQFQERQLLAGPAAAARTRYPWLARASSSSYQRSRRRWGFRQGNWVNSSSGGKALEILVVPSGGLALSANGHFA